MSGNFFQVIEEIPKIQPDIIFSIFGFPITNSFLMVWLIILLLIIGAIILNSNLKKNFNKIASFAELCYEALYAWYLKIAGTKRNLNRVLAIVISLFVYILISNLIGLIPGLTNILINDVPLFRSPTNDFNTTFGLAVCTILIIQVQSIIDFGIFGYIGRFIRIKNVVLGFKKGIGEGFMSLIDLFVGLLEVISELAKMLSLSLRLFGNLYAGEVLTIILTGILAYGLPSFWLAMSLLVGFIQALVFSSLVTIYYVEATKHLHDDEEHNTKEPIHN